jgi:inositol-phosphate transport system permease protein|tara:strand:- start:2421 stop:3647 length:1227 start_codon:yes stop_codon:yes gene_type:complete
MTGVFSLTNMSTATGITGGSYQITPSVLRQLGDQGFDRKILKRIGSESYSISEKGLLAAIKADVKTELVEELRERYLGETFASRRLFERFLKTLDNRPRSTRALKTTSPYFRKSLINERFNGEDEFRRALKELDLDLSREQTDQLVRASYTGWIWTLENFRRMLLLPETKQILLNTGFYVASTLLLFNIGFALVLAVTTFYLPKGQAAIFRALWFLPRITPSVLYVLLWKWLTWDTGFINAVVTNFGVTPRNWMLDTAANAWVTVILINGFIGASMGMIIFSSAMTAIPKQMLYASEVDGANRWQQIRHIILPQIKWPILFVTVYQTLSLLTSFEQIFLSTDGGPGSSTEVWALSAYHNALDNYWGNLQYGYGASLALVLVVVGVIMSLFYLRLFRFKELVKLPRIEQ